jgi:hypothetical protein
MTRTCGSCSLCCKLLSVEPLQKPRNEWCKHACKGGGCRIYLDRPNPCKTFSCSWLLTPGIGDRFRPDKIGLFVVATVISDFLQIVVDPAMPNAWRQGAGGELMSKLKSEGYDFVILSGDALISSAEVTVP